MLGRQSSRVSRPIPWVLCAVFSGSVAPLEVTEEEHDSDYWRSRLDDDVLSLNAT